MYILERIQRKKKMQELLKNLSEKKFIYKNGKFIREEKDLTLLSDEEMISIIKNYDSLNGTLKKANFSNETDIKKIKEILYNRVINIIKTSQSIINQKTNNLSYNEILQIKLKLQFYIINIIYDEKLLKLVNELDSILSKEDKKYEKARLSI